MSLLKGLQFILNTSVLKDYAEGEERELSLANGKTPLVLYTPAKQEKGLIITLTGFAINGYRDKRMVVVNNAFKKMGYRVITPQIKTIDALLIDPLGVDEVKDAIKCIVADPKLNPNKFRPAVFAPSFTAGIAAIAIAELPENTISSLCLLGGFSDFESTIEFAVSNEKNEDDYGMHILMKNFLKYEIGNNPKLEEIIITALEDNGLKRPIPLLPSLLALANPATIDLYTMLRNNAPYRREMILSALNKTPNATIWKNRLDLLRHAHKITCPITIIHGKDDNVIPSSQSVLLHSLLKGNKQQVHLELSDLLDHADLKVGFKIFSQIANLAKAFNYFIANTDTKFQVLPAKNEGNA
jgi:pimeloyl-ACP methyl ester carboxylesterase